MLQGISNNAPNNFCRRRKLSCAASNIVVKFPVVAVVVVVVVVAVASTVAGTAASNVAAVAATANFLVVIFHS